MIGDPGVRVVLQLRRGRRPQIGLPRRPAAGRVPDNQVRRNRGLKNLPSSIRIAERNAAGVITSLATPMRRIQFGLKYIS
ncbi:MAG TPA: hypothetical protein VFA04_06040 [Bryobacteraceae bacterium]|nr:hypothetical protein [Bryobacteraceae bacterium]